MKNGLGRNVNAGLKPLAQYVEALRAGRWRNESVSTDFHVLRQGIHPRRFEDEKRSWTGCQRGAKATCSVRGSPAGWPLARRVGFNRLSCAEAGFQSAVSMTINGLGRNVNAGLTHRVLREATCSVRGSPTGWRDESTLSGLP